MNSDSPPSKKGKLLSLKQKLSESARKQKIRAIDIEASHTILEQCLFFLEMNKLPELLEIKQQISKCLDKLEKLK